MEDAELAALASRVDKIETRIARLQKQAAKDKKTILQEMQRRKTRGLVTSGWKLTYVQQVPLVYDPDALRAMLDPEQWRAISSRTLDKDKLAAAIQDQTVDLEVVQKCAHEEPKAPYVLINPDKESME